MARRRLRIAILVALALAVGLSGCVALNNYYLPTSISKGTGRVWSTRVAATEAGADGLKFQYVIWWQVPTDFGVGWARQVAATASYTTTNMSHSPAAALTYIEGSSCSMGGAAPSGYKWVSFTGPVETMPVSGNRVENFVTIRGGMVVSGAATSQLYPSIKYAVGTYYDSNSDGTPDTYYCTAGASGMVTVP